LKPLSQPALYSSLHTQSETSFVPPYSSLLSDVKAVNNLTSHIWLNRFILDVLEGDIITINVVVAFILVFLIREWVVQQQPIINAAAHIRDAEVQLDVAERAAQRLHDLEAAALEDENLRPAVERYRHIFEQLPREGEASEDDGIQGTEFIGWYAMETLMDNAGVPHQFEGEDHEEFMEGFEEATEELLEQIKLAEDSGITRPDIAQNLWTILDNLGPTEGDLWREFLLNEDQTKYMLFSNLPEDKVGLSDDEYPEAGLAPSGSDTERDIDDGTPSEPRRRPAMPPRDASSHAQRVIQSLEESSNDFERDGHQDTELDGNSSRGSWQSITASSNSEPSNTTMTSRLPQLDTDHRQDDQDTNTANTTAPNPSTESRSETAAIEPNQSSTDQNATHDSHAEPEQISGEGSPADVQPAAESPAEVPTAPEQNILPQPQQPDEPHKGPIARLFDWFWADIVIEEENDPLPGIFDEEIVRNEAEEPPFVHVHGGEHVHMPENAQDPEVLQAAADAGLDAEAIEDAEDLEGVLELIGMQGPLAGLAQTAVFCGFLITATLWLAIGVPYFFGKIALLFLGNPITSMIMTPLRIVSAVADTIVDVTVYVGGAATYFGSQILTQLLSLLLGSIFSKLGLGYVESLAKRAHHAADGAGARLAGLFDGDGPVELGP
ncbi:hypothetical protein KCU86_g18479, partial [Aureobasidium melanogenum]